LTDNLRNYIDRELQQFRGVQADCTGMIPERLNDLVENFMLVIAVMTTVVMLAVQSF